jgi:predicted GTPase
LFFDALSTNARFLRWIEQRCDTSQCDDVKALSIDGRQLLAWNPGLDEVLLTAALNRWFDDAMEANPPPAPGGKRIKLRYITQAGTRPPRFVVFGTRLDMLPKSYERYLVNGIRAKLGFDAVPVRVVLKSAKNPYASS